MRIGTADAEAAAAAAAVSNNQLRYLITATTAARADKERSAIASTKQSFSFFLATFHPFFFIFSQTLYSRPKLLHFLALVVATATASASLSSSSSLLSSPAAVAARIFTTCRTLCKIRGMVSFLGKRSQKSKTFFLRHRPTTMTTTTTTTTTATTTTMEAWLNHQQMILYRR